MHKVRENTRDASEARSGQILRFSVMASHDNSNIKHQQNTFGTVSNLAWSRIMSFINALPYDPSSKHSHFAKSGAVKCLHFKKYLP